MERTEEKTLKTQAKLGQENAITLIALVVTIVILLILAGVTITMTLGENGLFRKAQEASAAYKKAEEDDSAWMDEVADMFDRETGGGDYYSDTKKVNAPKLSQGMIPIKYVSGNWVITTEDDADWYNYVNSDGTAGFKWANVMLSDGKYKVSSANYTTDGTTTVAEADLGSMFVWIPRYAYSINSYHTSANGEGTTQNITNVVFLKGVSNRDSNGTEYYASYNPDSVTTGSKTPTIVHPAFNFGGKALSGIWVAKFEASMAETLSTSTNNDGNKTVKVVPNAETWRYIQVGNCFKASLKMQVSGNPYGISGADSHLIKNSEWGAVAYFAASQYGKTPTINSLYEYDNSSNVYHEYAGGKDYKTNVSQSTTGNVTGIYDLNGGAWEYVAAYYDNGNSNLSGQGLESFSNNKLKSEYAKYWDKYEVGNDEKTIYGPDNSKLWDLDNSDTSKITATNEIRKRITTERYNLMKSIMGDAMYEVINTYSYYGKKANGDREWLIDTTSTGAQYGQCYYNSDYALIGNCALPFLRRGGSWWGGSGAGVFNSYGSYGYAYGDYGFRPVLAV